MVVCLVAAFRFWFPLHACIVALFTGTSILIDDDIMGKWKVVATCTATSITTSARTCTQHAYMPLQNV